MLPAPREGRRAAAEIGARQCAPRGQVEVGARARAGEGEGAGESAAAIRQQARGRRHCCCMQQIDARLPSAGGGHACHTSHSLSSQAFQTAAMRAAVQRGKQCAQYFRLHHRSPARQSGRNGGTCNGGIEAAARCNLDPTAQREGKRAFNRSASWAMISLGWAE